jgi:very-short-patch-repair endonuclease
MLVNHAKSPAVRPVIAAQTRGNSVDHLIASLAGQQHGVISRRDLLAAGVSRHEIGHRLAHGRLHHLYRGVYAVGHGILTAEGRWMAAVLAAGPGAVLSHRAGAALLGIRSPDIIEVTLERRLRQTPGIQIHELPLPPDEVTIERGIPVTIVPRTLFDLAAVLPRRQLERAINEADVRRLSDRLSLPDLLERYPHRWGAPVVRAILNDGVTVTRSELEARFLDFLRTERFSAPEVNAHLFVAGRWIECDCVWRGRRVIVELDGRAAHGTAAAFERDRARDRMLNARGWRLVRITWRQLRDDREALAYDLRAILSAGNGSAPSRSTSHVPSVS